MCVDYIITMLTQNCQSYRVVLAEDLETKLHHAPNSLSGYDMINWIFIYLSFCFSIRCRMNRHNFHILINKCEYIF